MKVFLTGATGLLGGHIANLLVREGHQVTLLLRQEPPQHLKKLVHVHVCKGDLSDPDHLSLQLEEMDVVIHAAADVSMNAYLTRRQFETNVTGLVNLMKAADHAGIKRFVYVSTASVFKGGDSRNPGTESGKIVDESLELPYVRTKLAAERFLLRAFREEQFPGIILNPTFMIGPGDHKPSSGQLILALLRKRILFYPQGGKNVIDVRDAARATVNAMTMGRAGENYILANENISYKDFFRQVASAAGLQLHFWKAPALLTKIVGVVGTLIEIWTRKPMQLNHLTAKVSMEPHYFSAAKARRELKLETRPFSQTIDETVNWLRDRFIGSRAPKETGIKHPALSQVKH